MGPAKLGSVIHSFNKGGAYINQALAHQEDKGSEEASVPAVAKGGWGGSRGFPQRREMAAT